MRMILGAAVAALIMAGTAAAQTEETPAAPPAPPAESACAAPPAIPTDLPDGAEANAQQMTDGNTAFNTWMEATNAALECRRNEAAAAIHRANSLRDQFNEANQAAAAARDGWVAEVEEFNARPQGRR